MFTHIVAWMNILSRGGSAFPTEISLQKESRSCVGKDNNNYYIDMLLGVVVYRLDFAYVGTSWLIEAYG